MGMKIFAEVKGIFTKLSVFFSSIEAIVGENGPLRDNIKSFNECCSNPDAHNAKVKGLILKTGLKACGFVLHAYESAGIYGEFSQRFIMADITTASKYLAMDTEEAKAKVAELMAIAVEDNEATNFIKELIEKARKNADNRLATYNDSFNLAITN